MRALRPLLCSIALLALSTPAFADNVWGDGVAVMSDDEMVGLRGGLAVMPGLDVNFGATITTFVNGAPALATELTWSDQGATVEQTIGELGRSLAPQDRAAFGIAGLENASGVVINDAQGMTALVHNVADGALQNIILNTASGRDLRQEVDVTLTLSGFAATQDALVLERIGLRLADDMRGISFE